MSRCPHLKNVKLLPGEEAEWMKPPYSCAECVLSNSRVVYRCLRCGALVCDAHVSVKMAEPPRPSQAPLRRGELVTTVRDGEAIHGTVRSVNRITFRWRSRNRSVDHVEVVADEHVEWARGHLDEEGKIALLAANALWRSRF